MWPVDEMGRNSVIPSTMAITMAWKMVILKACLVVGLWIAEDGNDEHNQSGEDDNGGDGDPSESINLAGVKHIWIRTASACHQQEANSHDAQPKEHPPVISLIKQSSHVGYRGFLRSGCCLRLFHELIKS
jgi:hypothetical protein